MQTIVLQLILLNKDYYLIIQMSQILRQLKKGGKMFKLHSEYKPTGDQPQAIEYLSKGIEKGKKFQTLLGVTGSR